MEIDVNQTPVRKRPDVIQRLKDRKGKQERVIKCSLVGRLTEKRLLSPILYWVHTVSRISNKGSLVFNRLLLHCFCENIPLPDLSNQTLYLQCFNIGSGRLNAPIYPLQDVWDRYFSDFPSIIKQRGDTQAYVYASKQYMTNFKNSLIFTFEGRQKHFIYRWCLEHNVDIQHVYPIRCAINRWTCRYPVPPEATEFISQQRRLLGTDQDDQDGITQTWLGKHMENVVAYFYYILKHNEQYEDAKRFTLAPISKIKSHFITIDTTVLFEMLKNVNLIDCSRSAFMDLKDDHFRSIFRLNGLCKGEFSNMIETDGVSACFHFKVPRKEENLSHRDLKDPSKYKRVIAIDPGRSNLIFGVEKKNDGHHQIYKLTRNAYYTSAGMKTMNKKASIWEKEIEQEELIFRRHSLKTTSGEKWRLFLLDYISVYEKLWRVKTKKSWGRERFRVYTLKRKTLDRFFGSMRKKGEEKPVIAYGAAKFNPNSKSELSAPTTFLSKRCSKHYPTIYVDEYNTTKVCHGCDEKLCPILKMTREEKKREIRGLRWCSSTKCRTLMNRDLNAALNILRCFRSGTNRPNSLSRNSGEIKDNSKKKNYLRWN